MQIALETKPRPMPEPTAQEQADRAQTLHQQMRRGPARNPELEVGSFHMNAQKLIDTAKALVASDKDLLATVESNPTCNERFARLGIPQTEEVHVLAEQQALYYRASCNRTARRSEYTTAMERTSI
jgi:hypothetical protein